MHRGSLICAALLIAACAKPQDSAQQPDSTAAPAPMSLAGFAGRWTMRGYNAAGDSIVGYTLTATADTSGWTVTFPGRPPIPMHVTVAGHTLRTSAGPYESALRRGVQVTTDGTLRMDGDSLVGTTIAHYATTGADSVLTIRGVGKRITP